MDTKTIIGIVLLVIVIGVLVLVRIKTRGKDWKI